MPPSISQPPPLAPGSQWQRIFTVGGPGTSAGEPVVADRRASRTPAAADFAGVAEGLEFGLAGAVEGDRHAADRVGGKTPLSFGPVRIAPMSKLGLPCLTQGSGAKTALRRATKAPKGAAPSV